MRILFLGLNYAPEQIGISIYSTGLCEALAAMGNDVRVVAGQPYYPDWKVPKIYRGLWRTDIRAGVRIVRCPLYVPRRPSGLKRLIHHASFALSALWPMLREAIRFKPDLVITVSPSLVAAPVAIFAARAAGAPAWLHIQDFEVEAAFATGLLQPASAIGRGAEKFERWIMRKFDHVSSISPEMCARLERSGISASRITELRNWADVERIRPSRSPSTYREAWKVRQPFVALYSGNIANKQGIEIVIQAAKLLRHRKDILFLICGQGPNRSELERQAADLENVMFQDLQPAEKLEDLLGLATVHLLPQKESAADLVLPSKLTNMLASGRPVIATAAQETGLAREIEGCGISTPPGDANVFAEAIETIVNSPELRSFYSAAARARAEDRWDRRRIIERLVDDLEILASRK